MAFPEFKPDEELRNKVAKLERDVENLQQVMLIMIAQHTGEREMAKRLAERVFGL